MAFGYTDGATNNGNSASAGTGVHGITINSGNLVVVQVNSNSTTPVTADAGGTLFTEAFDEIPSSQTARHALYWKKAGDSEPTSYSFTVGSAQWQVNIKVFTSASDAVVDAAATTGITSINDNTLVCNAIDGEVISDDALSIVCGGKDARFGSDTYTTADNSYVSVVGVTDGQGAALAHRIYTTGLTFSGDVTLEPTDNDDGMTDVTYSGHISFVEGAGGSTPGTLLLKGLQEL